MPTEKDEREPRRKAIASIITRFRIRNQSDLAKRLEKSGYGVTQSSISRDLRELGVLKVDGRYHLPEEAEQTAAGKLTDVAPFLRSVSPAGPNITVVHTLPGGAQSVGLAVDMAGWAEVVGTVAGHDTLFIATRSSREQRQVIHRLNKVRKKA